MKQITGQLAGHYIIVRQNTGVIRRTANGPPVEFKIFGDDGVRRLTGWIRRITNDTPAHFATWLQATEWSLRYIGGSQIPTGGTP
ncbi:hypothetical protein HAX54_020067, partial [Datura stramonium]|nr:hypothetical protein [Datura stramonium]